MYFGDFAERMIAGLESKGYTEVKSGYPIAFGLFKQTFGGMIPKVVGVHASFESTDNPNAVYDHSHRWFKKMLGNNGAGILLFTYYETPSWAVDEILELGKGRFGHGQVIGGVFDLSANTYWMSDHMGWGKELFG